MSWSSKTFELLDDCELILNLFCHHLNLVFRWPSPSKSRVNKKITFFDISKPSFININPDIEFIIFIEYFPGPTSPSPLKQV